MYQFDQVVTGAFAVAQKEAYSSKHTEMTPDHLLFGLLSAKSTYLSKAFHQYLPMVKGELKRKPVAKEEVAINDLRPSSGLVKWLTMANAYMAEAGKAEISERDLVKGMPQIFPQYNFDYELLKTEEGAENEVPPFLINLNELAAQGKLDPVIGRTKEIRAVMEILGRRGKNNPVLVGPAGVGKTAIIEGLADHIVKNQVPDILKGKTVYSLDLGGLMAGTKYRGEFEEKIQALLKFIKGQQGEAILFIDEIHQLVGAGRTDGAMDAANLLKPALARGELHCVGATTPEEFQKYILGDAALERRFRSVTVDEPTKEDAIEILMGLKEKFEGHHGIRIADDAIYQAVLLSDQYITDKNLPDKAIDLIDESASALKLSAQAMPRDLEELLSNIRSQKVLLQVEKDNESIKTNIERMQKEFDIKKEKWDKEVVALKKVSELKGKIDRAQNDIERFQREGNYEEASKLKYSMLPELMKQLETIEHNWILGKEHVANVIARQTGIPVEKILREKQDHILKLEEFLNKRIFGQEEAMHEVAETLMTGYAGLSSENRPLGSFLLLGPTGVGKTETAKALAQYLFEDEDKIVRLDLSEYSEKHSVAKLIGSPAGYVGYEEGGVLTEAVRKHPYSIVLFDEVEKAHSDFSDILLQILDEGRLTDNKGRVINFKNTIVLITSNSKDINLDFKPEVLGRIDSILKFHSLDKRVMQSLINKQLALFNERLKSKKVEVTLSPAFYQLLGERGYDSHFGARPLTAVFNKLVVRPLAQKILAAELPQGKVLLDWKDSELKIVRN
jgi:ATP-dependent Clp protease ATP-binding subunit ClpB